MKIVVESPNGFVVNAFFVNVALSMSIHINTTERHVRPDLVAYRRGSIEFWFYVEGYENRELGEMEKDVVSVVAESKEDEEILSRLVFEMHSAGQLWFLLPRDEVFDKSHKP